MILCFLTILNKVFTYTSVTLKDNIEAIEKSKMINVNHSINQSVNLQIMFICYFV